MRQIYQITAIIILIPAIIRYAKIRRSSGKHVAERARLPPIKQKHFTSSSSSKKNDLKPAINSRLLSYDSYFDRTAESSNFNGNVPKEYFTDNFFRKSSKYPVGTLRDPLSKDYNVFLGSAEPKIKKLRKAIISDIKSGRSFAERVKNWNKKHVVTESLSLDNVVRELKESNVFSLFPLNGFGENDEAANCLRKISEEIFDPNADHKLFRYGTDMKSQINPLWQDSERILEEMRVFGVIIARLAIEQNINADVNIESPFYAMLLGKPVTLEVISGADGKLKTNLEGLIFKDPKDYGLTFSDDDTNKYGQIINHPISKEFSPDQDVTNENKMKYIKALVDFKFVNRVKAKMNAFKKGFYSVINESIFNSYKLDIDEVEIMLTGRAVVDVNKLKKITKVTPISYTNSDTIKHFWEILYEMNEREKRLFLRLVTKRSDKIPEYMKIGIDKSVDRSTLPITHTCVNLIDFPNYENKALMKSKIHQAIKYTAMSNVRFEKW